jgi:hypothetical protein
MFLKHSFQILTLSFYIVVSAYIQAFSTSTLYDHHLVSHN